MLRRAGAWLVLPALLLTAGTAEARPALPRTQTGLASFYGQGFAGRRTASGRRFRPQDLIAAHRTLPLGSRVRVTNLANGRAVTVRIVDRGPFGRNRRRGCIIDLSRAAASRLGFAEAGLARVRLEVLRRK